MDPNMGKATLQAYTSAVKSDKRIQALEKRIRSGSGSYADIDVVASRAGQHAGKAIAGTVRQSAVDGMITKDVAAAILEPTMYDDYEYVSELAELVQQALNRRAGVGLKAVRPGWNQSRLDGLLEVLEEAEDIDAASVVLVSQIENASMAIVDAFVQENADFHYQVGLSPKIVRTAEAQCCEWCADLEGEYDYAEVKGSGNDVYRRHDNCRCTVEFVPGDGSRQNVHSKRIMYDSEAANRRVETIKRQEQEGRA